jgi:hypothetical protein
MQGRCLKLKLTALVHSFIGGMKTYVGLLGLHQTSERVIVITIVNY